MKKESRKKSGPSPAAEKGGAREEPPSYGAVRESGAAGEAVALLNQGCNCCQAVLSAYAERHGLERSTALKLGAGFGGGIGRLGETCGAITGAVLVLGLRHGSAEAAAKQKTAELVRKFVSRFKQRHGSTNCRQLLGCDLSKPEEFEWAVKQGLLATRCPKLVRHAVEILEELA
jgi:C_GCAxxG_C_C family probable redox protein